MTDDPAATSEQPIDCAAVLAALRARVARMERNGAPEAAGIALCGTIDAHLPGGGPVSYTHLTLPTIYSV